MNYKAVIFDFNGTLFFDNDKHIKAWGAISKLIRNRDITEDEIYNQFNGTPNVKNILYLTNNQATLEELEYYSLKKEEYYRHFCKEDKENFVLVDGVIDYFNHLKALDIPFTIASASIIENINFFIESFKLDKWIELSNIKYDDGTYENKIKMFQDAADILGVDIKDTLIFEDSLSGITNAYKAGCRNIIVVCDKQQEETFNKLPGVIKTIQNFNMISECQD